MRKKTVVSKRVKSDFGIYSKGVLDTLSKNSPWLGDVFDKLLYEHIRDEIRKVNLEAIPYNPYLYESLMADVSRLLDRCLSYRRECANLEGQAVSRALEYDSLKKTSTNDSILNALLNDTTPLSKMKKGQADTSAALTQLSKDPLKALTASFSGAAAASADAIINQTNKQKTLDDRIAILSAYQELLQLQHTTIGHALNYAERRDRVVELIKQDFAEAYIKAIAARAGLITQLGLKDNDNYSFPVPTGDIEDVDLLDRFVLWARDALRRYEIYCEDEVIVDVVISVTTPYFADYTNNANNKTLIEPGVFNQKMGEHTPDGGLLSISLANALPAVLKPDASKNYHPNTRLRAVGLSVGLNKGDLDLTQSWSAVIFLPSQASPFNTVKLPGERRIRVPKTLSKSVDRPPVALGRVLPYRSDATPAASSGDEVWNADILADNFQIFVQPIALQGTALTIPLRNGAMFNDLKIHLKVAARPSKRPADWQSGYWLTTMRGAKSQRSRGR